MTVPIKYRISSVAAKPVADSVKGVPLTSLEIDGNFRSIKDAIEDFSESTGSSLVGYDGGTVQDVLDNAKPLANYTALRAYTGRATSVRITTPGIAGFFQRDSDTTTADNGGTVIVDASGRRWKRVFDGVVHPEWFGAKCDGATSASTAIHALLSFGYDCYLSDGAGYLITSSILQPSNTKIYGPGKIIRGFSGGPVVLLTGQSNSVCESFEIDGRKDLYPASENSGIFVDWRATAGQNVKVCGVKVSNTAGSAVIALASAATISQGFIVDACRIEEVGSHGILAQDYIDNVTITQNFVKHTSLIIADRPGITASRYGNNVNISGNICIGSPSVAAGSVSVHGISVDISNNVTCDSNICSGWQSVGIEVTRSSNVTVNGNAIKDSQYGISLTGAESGGVGESSSAVLVSCNTVTSCSFAGIYAAVEGSTGIIMHRDVSVTGNVVNNCGGIGVSLRHISGLHVSGNSSTGNAQSGIQVLDCPNHFIDGNSAYENNIETIKSATLTAVGGLVTATVTSHGYTTGEIVAIWGAFPSRYNGSGYVITVVDSNTFTYGTASPGTSPAVGTISCAKMANGLSGGTAGTTFGGIRVLWSLFPVTNRGENRYGTNATARNGYRNTYDVGVNGIYGVVDNALFLKERPANVRAENVTSGAISNIKDGAAVYMHNGKFVIAYNNAGVLTYISIPFDGTTATWTHGTTI